MVGGNEAADRAGSGDTCIRVRNEDHGPASVSASRGSACGWPPPCNGRKTLDPPEVTQLASSLVDSLPPAISWLLRPCRAPRLSTGHQSHQRRHPGHEGRHRSWLFRNRVATARLGRPAARHWHFAVPQELLTKTGRLSAEERRLIEQHPRMGADVITRLGTDHAWLAMSSCRPMRRGRGQGILIA